MQKHTDEIIWEIFQKDQKEQGFEVTDHSIHLTVTELKRARARGGFTIGQLVHQAATTDWMALTFDDITGSPYRALASRTEADLSTQLGKTITLPMPLVSANMESVTGYELAILMARMGGLGILHQFSTPQEQAEEARKVKQAPVEEICIDGRSYKPAVDKQGNLLVGAAIGVRTGSLDRAELLINAGADLLVVDIAHGHADHMIKVVKKLKKLHPAIPVVAGNVVTPKGAWELCNAGADVLKVGVGPGAACTTRMVTGYGVPQISAIYETSLIAQQFDVKIMADGGIRTSGDMVKALAAGANTLMIGRLLAATNASNNFKERIIQHDPHSALPRYIEYYGSASALAKKKQNRGSFDAPEGRTIQLQYEGETSLFLARLITGMQSGISYAGSSRDPKKEEQANIQRLRTKSRWKRQTISGTVEGTKGLKL